jgi:hypothetical protein
MSTSPVYRQRQREEQALGLTHELCEIIHATTYKSLGNECVVRVKQAIKLRDCLGRARALAQAEELIELLEHLDEQDASGVNRVVALIAAPATA